MLDQKTSLNTFKRMEAYKEVSDHSGMKLNINRMEFGKLTNMFGLKFALCSHPLLTETDWCCLHSMSDFPRCIMYQTAEMGALLYAYDGQRKPCYSPVAA